MKITKIPKYEELNAPVGEFSPSSYWRISICPFPAVVNAAVRGGLCPQNLIIPSLNPSSYHGTIIHKLYEERVKGNIPDEDTYLTKWEQLIEYHSKKVTSEYGTLRNIDFEDYDKMYESCSSVLKVNVAYKSSGLSNCPSHTRKVEEWVTYPSLLKGKIDLLNIYPDGIEVVDYKSGEIYEKDGSIKESIVTQLNLYALCCEKQYSKPVTRLTIINTADNTEKDVPLRKNLFDDYIKSIKDLQSRINEAIRSHALETLQNFNFDFCKRCNCRHICASYVRESSDPYLVAGEVIEYIQPKFLKLKAADDKVITISKIEDIAFNEVDDIIGKNMVFVDVVPIAGDIYKRIDRTLVYERKLMY